MDSNRTISLHGFGETDQTVFCSLLSLLSFKTNAVWEVVEDETCDVTVVDVDSNQGLSLAEAMENNGRKVIRFGQYRDQGQQDACLHKPLRAADILKCLNNLNPETGHAEAARSQNMAAPAEQAVPGYRLRRWPCQKILSGYPGSSRLCALLMKEPLTISQVAERSGIAQELVWDFISACQHQNFVVEQNIAEPAPCERNDAVESNGLFAMLRMKFGSRG